MPLPCMFGGLMLQCTINGSDPQVNSLEFCVMQIAA